MPTYTVSTYDTGDTINDEWKWTVVATGVSKWGLRAILRQLYDRTYDVDSIAVDRED